MRGVCGAVKEFNLLIWLAQLGISVAAPLALCTLISVWLRERFRLGSWILLLGIGFGLYLAIDGFRTSLKAMEHMNRSGKKDASENIVSFNEHE